MSANRWNDISLPLLLTGVILAEGPEELRNAVTEAAEDLTKAGVLILDRDGKPAQGITDERAVMGALATYAQELARKGNMTMAMDIGKIVDRVDRLQHQPLPKRHLI